MMMMAPRQWVTLSYPIAAQQQVGQDPRYALVRSEDGQRGGGGARSSSSSSSPRIVDRYPHGRGAGWAPERCTYVDTGARVPAGGSWALSAPPPQVAPSMDSLVTSASVLYGKGPADALLALFWAVAFTVLRECVMRGVYAPGWRWWVGRRKRKERNERERKRRGATVAAAGEATTTATRATGRADHVAENGSSSSNGKLRKRRKPAAAAATRRANRADGRKSIASAGVMAPVAGNDDDAQSAPTHGPSNGDLLLRPPRLASRLSTEELDTRASPPPSSTSSTSSRSSASSDDGLVGVASVDGGPTAAAATPRAHVVVDEIAASGSFPSSPVADDDDDRDGEKARLREARHRHRVPSSSSSAAQKAARKERAHKAAQRTVTRFAEQGWTFTYASVSWSTGMYILSHARVFPLSSEYIWAGYPHTPLPALTKLYYLAQLGFWLHQLVILNVEARRKDHWQMLTHHVVTIALVVASYCMNFTRVGTVILALMDFCDILLPLAKMFRYLSLPTLTDATFVFFLVSWLITRQIGFLLVFLSVCFRSTEYMPVIWAPEHEFFLSPRIVVGFATLLGGLQVMNAIWFYMACKVAYRVVRGLGAEDTRSDDEGDMDDAAHDDENNASDLEQEDGEAQHQRRQDEDAERIDDGNQKGGTHPRRRGGVAAMAAAESAAPPSMRTRAKAPVR